MSGERERHARTPRKRAKRQVGPVRSRRQRVSVAATPKSRRRRGRRARPVDSSGGGGGARRRWARPRARDDQCASGATSPRHRRCGAGATSPPLASPQPLPLHAPPSLRLSEDTKKRSKERKKKKAPLHPCPTCNGGSWRSPPSPPTTCGGGDGDGSGGTAITAGRSDRGSAPEASAAVTAAHGEWGGGEEDTPPPWWRPMPPLPTAYRHRRCRSCRRSRGGGGGGVLWGCRGGRPCCSGQRGGGRRSLRGATLGGCGGGVWVDGSADVTRTRGQARRRSLALTSTAWSTGVGFESQTKIQSMIFPRIPA